MAYYGHIYNSVDKNGELLMPPSDLEFPIHISIEDRDALADPAPEDWLDIKHSELGYVPANLFHSNGQGHRISLDDVQWQGHSDLYFKHPTPYGEEPAPPMVQNSNLINDDIYFNIYKDGSRKGITAPIAEDFQEPLEIPKPQAESLTKTELLLSEMVGLLRAGQGPAPSGGRKESEPQIEQVRAADIFADIISDNFELETQDEAKAISDAITSSIGDMIDTPISAMTEEDIENVAERATESIKDKTEGRFEFTSDMFKERALRITTGLSTKKQKKPDELLDLLAQKIADRRVSIEDEDEDEDDFEEEEEEIKKDEPEEKLPPIGDLVLVRDAEESIDLYLKAPKSEQKKALAELKSSGKENRFDLRAYAVFALVKGRKANAEEKEIINKKIKALKRDAKTRKRFLNDMIEQDPISPPPFE